MVGIPLSEDEIHQLLIEERTCWLGTVTPDGRPHLIPIHFGFFEGKVHIIFVSSKSKSVKNIESNPNVCFGINIGYRAGEIKCVLIHGKAEIIDKIHVVKEAHLKILAKYLPSKGEAEELLQKLTASGAIRERVLIVIVPSKTMSWRL